jgi:hypothetical protein
MVRIIGWGQDVQEASGLGHYIDLVLVVHVWREIAVLVALVAGSGSTGLHITGPPLLGTQNGRPPPAGPYRLSAKCLRAHSALCACPGDHSVGCLHCSAAGTHPGEAIRVPQVHVGSPGQIGPQWMQHVPVWEDVAVLGGYMGHQAFNLFKALCEVRRHWHL